MNTYRAAITTMLCACCSNLARGQCSGYVLEPGPGSPAGQVSAITVWDPDGPGPAPLTLVASAGNSGGYVKIWDGAAWQPLGPASTFPLALTVFNGDLVAAGGFGTPSTARAVSRWDGAAWAQLGAGQEWFAATPRNFAIHQGQLFTNSGHQFVQLNGTAWQYLGPSAGEYANALVSFRGDLIGGGILSLGGSPPQGFCVVRWGGAPGSWFPVGSGSGTFASQLGVHNGYLLVAGESRIQQWDGATWETLGNLGACLSVASYNGQLIVGGRFLGGVSQWDGTNWITLGSGISGGLGPSVERMVEWNGDLIITGRFTTAGGLPAGSIARYRCIPCYANCNNSLNAPILNANDFQCFLNKFAAADSYANCDGSTLSPVLNANDFQCFLNRFAAGCT